MKKCVRCNSKDIVKSGVICEKQRYRCQECNYHFTVVSKGIPDKIKRIAVHLWLEGLSIRNIGRILDISDVAIGKWIHPVKSDLGKYRKQNILTKELHSIEHFMISKEMFKQFGWLIIGMEENEDICLVGTTETRNCQIRSKS